MIYTYYNSVDSDQWYRGTRYGMYDYLTPYDGAVYYYNGIKNGQSTTTQPTAIAEYTSNVHELGSSLAYYARLKWGSSFTDYYFGRPFSTENEVNAFIDSIKGIHMNSGSYFDLKAPPGFEIYLKFIGGEVPPIYTSNIHLLTKDDIELYESFRIMKATRRTYSLLFNASYYSSVFELIVCKNLRIENETLVSDHITDVEMKMVAMSFNDEGAPMQTELPPVPPIASLDYGDARLFDLREDTVSADKLAYGITAHDRKGNCIYGKMQGIEIFDVAEFLAGIDENYDPSTFQYDSTPVEIERDFAIVVGDGGAPARSAGGTIYVYSGDLAAIYFYGGGIEIDLMYGYIYIPREMFPLEKENWGEDQEVYYAFHVGDDVLTNLIEPESGMVLDYVDLVDCFKTGEYPDEFRGMSDWGGYDFYNTQEFVIAKDDGEYVRFDTSSIYHADMWSSNGKTNLVIRANGYYFKIVQDNNTVILDVSNHIDEWDNAIDRIDYSDITESNLFVYNPVYQSKTISPTEDTIYVTPDDGYDALDKVTVNGIWSGYVGSGITRRSETDLLVDGATITTPAGYYPSSATKNVNVVEPADPYVSKGTVTNHQVVITPKVVYEKGYITTGVTATGEGVTVSASDLVSGSQTLFKSGDYDVTNLESVTVSANMVGSGITMRTSGDLTVNGASVSVPSGYYANPAIKSVGYVDAGTPSATKGTVTNNQISITPTVTNTEGYINGGTKTGTAVTVKASDLVSGSETLTQSGDFDVTNLASVTVSGNIIGSNVPIRSAANLTASGATVSVTSGYYASTVSKSVATGTAGTPSASKGTVTNNQVIITPTVTNTTGYITGGTKTGSTLTVKASDLVSGSQTITENNKSYDVTNLATVEVAVPSSGGGMNVQGYHGYATVTSTSYTATAVSLTVKTTGLYTVSWMGFRNTNSGTSGSQLYINNSAYGSANTSFVNTYAQSVKLTNVSLTAGQTIVVRARARSTSYVMGVGNLIIEQTS